jgi:hypothetical protein
MVHALKEICRVVNPGGCLLDLRPRATDWQVEIVIDGQVMVAGRVDNAPHVPDEQAADRAIIQMVEGGWLALEKQAICDCNLYWPTLDDMATYYAESPSPPCTIPQSLLVAGRTFLKESGQNKQVRIRLALGFSVYRRQPAQAL